MEAGRKEKTFFLESTAYVCVTNGGEVRGLGVGGEGRWKKKSRKRRLCVESCGKENLAK